jgi:hypothetical protein
MFGEGEDEDEDDDDELTVPVLSSLNSVKGQLDKKQKLVSVLGFFHL